VNSVVKLEVLQLPNGAGLALPAYQSALAAGLDLLAAVPEDAPVVLAPGKYVLVPTGLSIALPSGYEAQVRPRSGLAAKHGVTVLNAPGTVDADYRGEIGVPLINHGEVPFTIRRGERIAQMVIASVVQAELVPVTTLSATTRGKVRISCSFWPLKLRMTSPFWICALSAGPFVVTPATSAPSEPFSPRLSAISGVTC